MVKKYVPLAITYQESGLVKDRQAFVLPEDAYQELNNIFLWRGRLRKRQGYDLLGRLRRFLEDQAQAVTTEPTYSIADLLSSVRGTEPNASLEPGSVQIIVNPGGAQTVFTDDGEGGFTRTSGTGAQITSASFVNYQTGAISLTWSLSPGVGAPVNATYGYFPAFPVMGIPNRELSSINAEQTIAFDTKYAYQYSNTDEAFREVPSTTPTTWNGTDADFFWALTYWQTADYNPYFWATNFNKGNTPDPIRVYDGVDWHTFAPTTSGTNEMHQCLMLFPYKGRLVALNTWEGTTLAASQQHPQRARWSQNGAPLSSVNAGVTPTATVEWLSDVKGRGGFNDAPTSEHIVSAEFIRDLLVVGFEHSTWALRYTGNELLPFVWERINRELGCESTNSMVPFDRGILYIGDKSINSCSGTNVDRIDDKIPNEVFEIANSNDPASQLSDGPRRVHGIRDFFERLVYWTFPDAAQATKFPNRVLVFNYQNQSWAQFSDAFTCFGKFQRFNDVTWADIPKEWRDANDSWITAKFQSQFPDIVAGNQQGYVLIMNKTVTNSVSLYISAITGGTTAVVITSPDHTLLSGDYVEVRNVAGNGADELNRRVFQISVLTDSTIELYEKPRFDITAITRATAAVVTAAGHNFQEGQAWYIDQVSGMTEINGKNGIVVSVDGDDITLDIDSTDFTAYTSDGAIQNLDGELVDAVVPVGTYLGGGEMIRVMNFSARSKKFNILEGDNKASLGFIDFLANRTDGGEIAVNIYTDYNDSTPANDGEDTFFNQVISTQREQFSQPNITKDWHRFFCNNNCQFFEYQLTFNERQMFTPNITGSEVWIDAIIINSGNAGRLVS